MDTFETIMCIFACLLLGATVLPMLYIIIIDEIRAYRTSKAIQEFYKREIEREQNEKDFYSRN